MKKIQIIRLSLFALALPGLLHSQESGSERDPLVEENTVTSASVRTPAEFEPQDAVWLAWPAYDYEADLPMAALTAEMIRVLQPYVPVKLLVRDSLWQATAEHTLDSLAVPTDHLTYVTIPYEEPWLRDMGPVFVIADGNAKQMVDFNFNSWGLGLPDDPYSQIEEQVDRLIAAWMGIENNRTSQVGEGGNRIFNGQGVMMSVAPTELQRNPESTLEQIEAEFKRLFGVSTVIWLPHHLYDDSPAPTVYPGPDGEKAYAFGVGHVDQVARFVGPNTILLVEVPEAESQSDTFAIENHRRLEENHQILLQARNQAGEPFEIVRIPVAMTEYFQLTEEDFSYIASNDILHDDGILGHEGPIWWIAAKNYINFVVTNGVVLVPQYWRPGRPALEQQKDAEAVQVLQTVFPGRDIIPFTPELALTVNLGSGGLHTLTACEPKISVPSSVGGQQSMLPGGFSLQQNYPNPFNPSTVISFQLPITSDLSLSIYNLHGQLVKQVASGKYASGRHQFTWNGTDARGRRVASGVYLYRLVVKGASGASTWRETKRVILMK